MFVGTNISVSGVWKAPAAAAPSEGPVLEQATASNLAQDATITLSLADEVPAGAGILVGVSSWPNEVVQVTDDLGATYSLIGATNDANDGYVSIYASYDGANASARTITVEFGTGSQGSGAFASCCAIVVTDITQSDNFGTATDGSSPFSVTPSVVVSGTATITMLAACFNGSGPETWTGPALHTEIFKTSNGSVTEPGYFSYRIESGVGARNATVASTDNSASGGLSAVLAVFGP
jgi:hypothetical protein